jgi:hypothetical protein
MANIRKEMGRHDWQLRRGIVPGPNVGRNVGDVWICRNCRAYRYGAEAEPPPTGCLSDVKVASLGHSRQHDHFLQEERRREAEGRREYHEEIAAGARRPDGSIIYE